MKKLIAAALLTPTIAMAQVFVAPNEGGGEIVITGRDCVYNNKKYESMRAAYAWSPNHSKVPACWGIQDGNIVVVYLNDGDERVYPINAFREKK
jgi:hypothetical protein